MMKKELLAPAGDRECLYAAIHNGADAVYLSGKSFGARKFARNFSHEELEEAVKYAHLYGVKIYVTVNTIIYEEEIEECLSYLSFLYRIGVDAVIVQDIGLITLIHEYIPDLEIHASTQTHTHNLEQIKLLSSLGVKRVVLAREMSIQEINQLDTDMELEVFIHGALCISYSGQCLFSSGVLGRSGNRGECAGLCRMPYHLLLEDKTILKDTYLLSPKEFNTTDYLHELKKSRVYSFKIEGRMKSPEYVGYVTRIYRKLLDDDQYHLSEEEIFNLKSLYNRGFTKGYLFSNTDSEFISLHSSNHQGVKIGEVIHVSKNKIKIKLTHDLYQGDAIRLPNREGMYVNFLYNDKMMLIHEGHSSDIVYLDNKVNLDTLGDVLLTINQKLVSEIKNTPEKKIKIKGYVYAHSHEKLIVRYSDGVHEVEYIGNMVDVAKNIPITKDRIFEIISKLGNTPFLLEDFSCDITNDIFIPVGVLNEIRRNLIQELISKRSSVERHLTFSIKPICDKKNEVKNIRISALARNQEQVKTLLRLNVDTIYVTNKDLYHKYKDYGVYLRLSRVNSFHDTYQHEKLLLGESGSLIYASQNDVISDYYFNVVNHAYVHYLKSLGVKRITLSPELSIPQIELLCRYVEDSSILEVIAYGRIEYMIMKYRLKENMNLKDNHAYYLKDNQQRKYSILDDGYTHLMSDKPIDYLSRITELKKAGISVFRLELFDEIESDIEKIVTKIREG